MSVDDVLVFIPVVCICVGVFALCMALRDDERREGIQRRMRREQSEIR